MNVSFSFFYSVTSFQHFGNFDVKDKTRRENSPPKMSASSESRSNMAAGSPNSKPINIKKDINTSRTLANNGETNNICKL